MIWTFFVSTSVSMNRYFSGQFTYLECAKAGVERIIKAEQSYSSQSNNRYILVTYEDYPDCYRTISNVDSINEFLSALKVLEANNMPKAGMSFSALFGYLDSFFHKQYFETLGQGRYPGNIEMVTIVWFTDGEKYIEPSQRSWEVTDELHIPGHRLPVKDVFYEPFRWNQTLNTVDMVPDGVEANPKIREMSDAMGGVYSRVTSLNDLLIFVNSCVNHKYKSNSTTPQFHEGVIVVLVEYGNNDKQASHRLKIYSNKNNPSLFPIPEPYWVDGIQPNPLSKTIDLPIVSAHPVITYFKEDIPCYIPPNFHVDRIPISSSCRVIKELISKKVVNGWQLYVKGSHMNQGIGAPFGLLKYDHSSRTPYIYLMPYDYPILFSIIKQLSECSPNEVPVNLQNAFISYLHSIPSYYRNPISKALHKCNLSHIWPQSIPTNTDSLITEYSKSLVDTARREFNSIQQALASKKSKNQSASSLTNDKNTVEIERIEIPSKLFDLQEHFICNFMNDSIHHKSWILLYDEKDCHSVPIIKMGDFTAKMASIQVLRNPLDDEEAARQKERNIFGNRYRRMEKTLKIDKQDVYRGVYYNESIDDHPQSMDSAGNSIIEIHNDERLPRRSSISSIGNSTSTRSLKRKASYSTILPPLCSWNKVAAISPIPLVLPWKYSRTDIKNSHSYYSELIENANERYHNSSILAKESNIDSMKNIIVGCEGKAVTEDNIRFPNDSNTEAPQSETTLLGQESEIVEDAYDSNYWKPLYPDINTDATISRDDEKSPYDIQLSTKMPSYPIYSHVIEPLSTIYKSFSDIRSQIFHMLRAYPRDFSETKVINFIQYACKLEFMSSQHISDFLNLAAQTSLKYKRHSTFSLISKLLEEHIITNNN